jgi:hypothetical protein
LQWSVSLNVTTKLYALLLRRIAFEPRSLRSRQSQPQAAAGGADGVAVGANFGGNLVVGKSLLEQGRNPRRPLG